MILTGHPGGIDLSNEKLPSPSYNNFGGMNSKVSPYLNSPIEFLNLINLDFQTPGSLSERWGSTMYVGQTFPGQINWVSEFSYLNGSSFIGIGYSGGIYVGATTGQCQGISLTNLGSTFSQFCIFAAVAFSNGVSSISGNGLTLSPIELLNVAYPYLGVLGSVVAEASFAIDPMLQSDNNLSVATIDNFLFAADGNKFFKYDGITAYPVGLPPPLRLDPILFNSTLYYTSLVGATDIGFAWNGTGLTAGASGMPGGASLGLLGSSNYPGMYISYASYVNNRGFEGPIFPIYAAPAQGWINGSTAAGLSLAAGPGGTYLAVKVGLLTPLQYGISTINIYTYYSPTIDNGLLIGLTYPIVTTSNGALIGNGGSLLFSTDTSIYNAYPYVLTGSYAASGSTVTLVGLGSSIGGQSNMIANIGQLPDTLTQSYLPLGMTAVVGPFQGNNQVRQISLTNYFPQILENYSSRLWSAGYSATPSVVWFSDTAEPEGYSPDFNFEVRTNDGDYITALRSYQTRLLIFKGRSFHVLVGNDPSNFDVNEVSDQHGCINKNCVVVGGQDDESLFFLDPKGIVQWNGALPSVISRKIQPVFDSMNLSAAKSVARMVHDKTRNQILCAIPVNGSSSNNLIVVYDYLVGGWTTYNGVNPTAMAPAFGYNNQKYVLFGDSSGRVNYFGPSFLADNGAGFTTYLKSRFFHDMGESIQKQFRRLFLDVDSPASSTLVFGVNFFQDYGSSVVLGTTMILSQFQNRIDYGISAKSIAFEMSNFQTNTKLRIHGFTIESRLQRRV